MTRRTGEVFAAGAVAGVVVSVVVAAMVWPRGSTQAEADGATPIPRATVTVPATDAPSGSASPSSSSSGEDKDKSDKGKSDKGDEPSGAAVVAGAAAAGQGKLPSASTVTCPAASTKVSNSKQLTQALAEVRPGQTIQLADGTYDGNFTAKTSGSEGAPIFLCGSRKAVLNGGDTENGYVLHLDHVTSWRVIGFSVTNGQKGVIADTTTDSVIQGLKVTHTGDEGIHLRDQSTDNLVVDNVVSDTGNRRDKFGEGVYIGTAVSNWCSFSDCKPDRSDRNIVKGNTITHVKAEAVDIKEGTTGGVLVDNTFDGSDITGADSWVDVKGNNWLVKGNTGTNAPQDGFQTHQILDGWGDHNVFSGNTATVNGPGFGIASQPPVSNRVTCDNKATKAGEGLSNITCS